MDGTARRDLMFMRQALALSRRGLGLVWPNPAVGCILVARGRIVGRGWTQPGGRPHAETMALTQAGSRSRGATAYVTLEPCAHHGKTPPCADALIAAGVRRVVIPMEDPDPRVKGRSISRMRNAGIEVITGIGVEEAQSINAGFLSRIETGRPTVSLKLATTIDGRIATKTGQSQWITGSASRRQVHLWRATHDAILIGTGTALADDPLLNVRELGLENRAPIRVVADTHLRTPTQSRLVQSARDIPLWLAHGPNAKPDRIDALQAMGAACLAVPANPDGRVNIAELLQQLGSRGITRVFCEGGGQIAASFLSAGRVDRLIIATAGKIIGGDGLGAIASLGLSELADAPLFRLSAQYRVGDDLHAVWERIADHDAR